MSTRPARRHRRSALIVIALAGGLAMAAAFLADVGMVRQRIAAKSYNVGEDDEEPDSQKDNLETKAVEVRDLVETSRLSGAIGFEEPINILARTTGSVSQAPKAGTLVHRGDELFRIDDRPTVAMYGESAAWRGLEDGVEAGIDIRQLEENLSAQGYDPDQDMGINNEWSLATTKAVKRWQRDLGVADDGIVRLGDVAFLLGPGQIVDVEAARGLRVSDGSPLFSYQAHLDVDTVSVHQRGLVWEVRPLDQMVVAGSPLISIDSVTTYALIGDGVANVRELKSGVEDGQDIRVLEENLVALEYDPDGEVVVDQTWDLATTESVKRWENALGGEETGRTTPELFQFVEPGSMVVGHLVTVGDELDGQAAVLEVGRSLRRIETSISTADQHLVAVGDTVTISLESGAQTEGVIQEIATIALLDEAGDSVVSLGITATDQEIFGDLMIAPVRVHIETKRVDAVLAVPTAALIGLVGGGHEVEVVSEEGTTNLLAVELGESADGWIEITEGSLAEGQLLVVPR